MTTSDTPPTSTSTEPGESADRSAPVPGFAEARGRVDVGPLLTLPTLALMGASLGAAAAVSLVGWGVVLAVGPSNSGNAVLGVWLGGAAVGAGHVLGLLAMTPWRPRRLGRWPFTWLIGRGVSFACVLIFGVLLYSAARPGPLPFGLVIASGYFAALMAEVAVYAAHVRSLPRPVSE